ncbi:unnamed protein product [Meganyctiphanes norvegica]|uniref:Importin N-terminal domain-containing protein n=1 Tax=Meganyctiphanes norvegica TaxID=48144 RepID=A0AAV2QQY3_MEGNR
MDLTPQMQDIVRQLIEAVRITLDPTVPHQVRLETYNHLEKVKEDIDLVLGCGFHLAAQENEAVVRHLGLQLLEHAIKYKWNNLSVDQKMYIKNNTMQLIKSGMLDLLSEQNYVKDKVSRLVVEMMKREWPQQWPELLSELHQLSRQGPTQTELVLFVFLRIAEDVATLQNLESNQRRRDLYQAMTTNMESIFGFFLSLLEDSYCQYQTVRDQPGLEHQFNQHGRVIQVVLMTLSVYVEWVSVQHIFSNEGKLLQSLCILLQEDNLRMNAAECLLQIVSRKGKGEERRPLLLLFGEAPMKAIFAAADKAFIGNLTEHNYRFLKTLTQVLTALGGQLCALWGKEPGVEEPSNLRTYMDAMLALTRHQSLHIYNFTNALWGQLFRHDLISKSPELTAVLPTWIATVSQKVMKHGYPSKNDSESCQYSRLDFDSDEEYSHFFYKVRSETLEIIKHASLLDPFTMYSFAEDRLQKQLNKSCDTGSSTESRLYNQFSPFFLEWDALAKVVESIMSRVMVQGKGKWKPPAESGINLLQLCLAYQTTDPLILSALLSCISGLFVFIQLSPNILSEVLNKIFSALTFSLPGQKKDSRSRTVKNVRRHGAVLMTQIVRDYLEIWLEKFYLIVLWAYSLSRDPFLNKIQKVTLQEALVLISNHYNIYEKQSAFIGKVVHPVSEIWLNMRQAFSSPREFMSFVGLDKPPVEPSENDVNGQNRAQVIFCVNLMLAVIKRSERPSDPEIAERGGFVLERTAAGTLECRNPATPHIMPLLHQLFCLVRLFNGLWHDDSLKSISTGYAKAHSMTEAERNDVLGLTPSSSVDQSIDVPKVQQPLERMQYFLLMVHDNCYHILGNAGPSLGLEFYQYPHLAEYIVHSALTNLDLIPDYRLRPVIRIFLKPFIQACPPSCHQALLLPVLNHLTSYMVERLSKRWDHLTSLIESGTYEEENTNTEEMMEDMLIRMLTREYIDLIQFVIPGPVWDLIDKTDSLYYGITIVMVKITNSEGSQSRDGALVFGKVICNQVNHGPLKALWWCDSSACLKAVGGVSVVLRWLVEEGQQHLSPAAVRQIMMAVLQGLHAHGQHEANQSTLTTLGLMTYELFYPHFPQLREVLQELPGVKEDDIAQFEEKLKIHPKIQQ